MPYVYGWRLAIATTNNLHLRVCIIVRVCVCIVPSVVTPHHQHIYSRKSTVAYCVTISIFYDIDKGEKKKQKKNRAATTDNVYEIKFGFWRFDAYICVGYSANRWMRVARCGQRSRHTDVAPPCNHQQQQPPQLNLILKKKRRVYKFNTLQNITEIQTSC